MRPSHLFLALALVVFGTANAEDSKTRSYSLPGHGYIELDVPVSWQDSVRQPPDALPPTITFTAASGAHFQVIVTPFWAMGTAAKPPTNVELSRLVHGATAEAAQSSVEKTLEVKDMGMGSNVGYYFTATDRAPKPDEYKYLNQGMMRVGDLSIAFTILTNDGQEKIAAQALSMVSGTKRK
jgi:hypothetical protein